MPYEYLRNRDDDFKCDFLLHRNIIVETHLRRGWRRRHAQEMRGNRTNLQRAKRFVNVKQSPRKATHRYIVRILCAVFTVSGTNT